MRVRIDQQISNNVAEFLISLGPEQIDYFKERLEESNERYQERYEKRQKMPDEEWREFQYERIIDRLEDWYGDLTDDQKSRIIAHIHLERPDWEQRRKRRIQVQTQIIELLREKETSNEIRELISSWFMDPSVFTTPDKEKKIEKRASTWMDYWISLNEILTAEQKQHALNLLQDYIDDMLEIHQS